LSTRALLLLTEPNSLLLLIVALRGARAQEVKDALENYLLQCDQERQRKLISDQRKREKQQQQQQQQQQRAEAGEVAAEVASMAEYLEQQSPRYDEKGEEDAFFAHPPGGARWLAHLCWSLTVWRGDSRSKCMLSDTHGRYSPEVQSSG
jgi:hypothetical protein